MDYSLLSIQLTYFVYHIIQFAVASAILTFSLYHALRFVRFIVR